MLEIERMIMRSCIPTIAALLLLPGTALAQNADKLPPANPIPYEDADVGPVLAVANRFLATLSSNDPKALLAEVRAEGGATATMVAPDGTHRVKRMGWSEFAGQLTPDGHRYEEKLIGPAVEIDGDIAMIWSPYVLLVDGKLGHCGTDHFDLVRENGQWKILNVTWTQRKEGCPQP